MILKIAPLPEMTTAFLAFIWLIAAMKSLVNLRDKIDLLEERDDGPLFY